MLIVTGDDYGLERGATDSILRVGAERRITSASAMVFMADSERAAALARNSPLEFGLHLNFTERFSASNVPAQVRAHQEQTGRFLKGHPLARVLLNPRLRHSFRVVVESQYREYERLYGSQPPFVNGHHHMHLCANVLVQGLIPGASRIRTTFTFEPGEKGVFNRFYRAALRRWILWHYTSTDAFCSIEPTTDLARLKRVVSRSLREAIEIETHPASVAESVFLLGIEYETLLKGARLRRFSDLPT